MFDTTHGINFEIYIVDNNSTDGSLCMIRKEFPTVNLIENTKNIGFARANNKAIRKSKGKFVLLLNSDTVVLKYAITKMVGFMKEHKEVGVLGCKLFYKNGSLQLSAGWFPTLITVILGGNIVPMTLSRLIRIKRFPGQTYLSKKDHDKLQEVDWVVGACMLVRHEAIYKAGLLDENLFMYGEEIEWCIRIKNAGWSVVYFPNTQIIHLGGGSTNGQSELCLNRQVFAERYLYHKHNDWLSCQIYDLLLIIIVLIKVPLWGLLLLVTTDKQKALTHLCYHRTVLKSLLVSKRLVAK